MNFFLAFSPILLILALMLGLRWSASRAGSAGYLLAMLVAWEYFGATPEILAFAHVRGFFLAVDVLLIIWAAFFFYRVTEEGGAIRTISLALPHLTADKGWQALFLGWIFASFLQGVGGFGVPVAVIAPILIGLGFSPLISVVIPSLGHGWAVTFGSMGSSFQALMSTTGLSAEVLAPVSAVFLGLASPICGLMIAHAAGGWSEFRRLFWIVLLLGIAMGSVQFLMAVSGFWMIAAFTASLVGLLLSVIVVRMTGKKEVADAHFVSQGIESAKFDPVSNKRMILLALSSYVILILITLVFQLIPALKQTLGGITFQLEFPSLTTGLGYTIPAGTSRGISLLRHTGFILGYASLLTYLLYSKTKLYRPGSWKKILNGTVQRVLPSSISIVSMVTMAVIMDNSGMTETLAHGLAASTGAYFPLMSPWIGALGAFMTGSNTNSNVVFGLLQMKTAEVLRLSVFIILAVQTSSAALASILAPTKVVVGASTASMAGREGEIMRRLLIYTLPLIFLVGFLAYLAMRMVKLL